MPAAITAAIIGAVTTAAVTAASTAASQADKGKHDIGIGIVNRTAWALTPRVGNNASYKGQFSPGPSTIQSAAEMIAESIESGMSANDAVAAATASGDTDSLPDWVSAPALDGTITDAVCVYEYDAGVFNEGQVIVALHVRNIARTQTVGVLIGLASDPDVASALGTANAHGLTDLMDEGDKSGAYAAGTATTRSGTLSVSFAGLTSDQIPVFADSGVSDTSGAVSISVLVTPSKAPVFEIGEDT